MKNAFETASEIYAMDYTNFIKIEDKKKEFNPLNYWDKHEKQLDLIAGISLVILIVYAIGVFIG